jgi:endoglucanase
LQWYEDVRSILEANNIAWANWDYRGGFGIVGRDRQPDEGLIKALIPK